MPKDGSFKRAVRRHAAATDKKYTQALATMRADEFDAQVYVKGSPGLAAHLEARYGISVASTASLEPHGDGVIRIDRHDGPAWIVRVSPPSRPMDRVQAEVDVLRFLDEQGYPAERLAHAEPISVHDGRPVVVTELVRGRSLTADARGQGIAAGFLGRLHALPASASLPEGGASGPREGRPSRELETCRYMLDIVPKDVTAKHRPIYESLCATLERADACDGLPEALTHPNLWPGEVVVTDAGEQVVIDWSGGGRGPRLSALAAQLWAGHNGDVDDEVIGAIVAGYSEHVRLTPEELDRLGAAMIVRSAFYACFRYWRIGGGPPKPWDNKAHASGDITAGITSSMPQEDLAYTIAAKVRAAL